MDLSTQQRQSMNQIINRIGKGFSLPAAKFQAVCRSGSIFKFPLAKFQLSIFILLISFSACNSEKDVESEIASATTYTCPMHPQIVEKKPGSCPICGMDLVAVRVEGGDSPVLMLSESQILLANIKTAKAGLANIDNVVVLTGRVAENEALSEVVSSRVPGRIERLYVKEEGQKIEKGQALYDIYSEELLTYQQEYLLALEQYQQLGEEEPRYASFAESARRKLKLYGMTDAQIQKLAARKTTDPLITFVAPVSGVVTKVSALEGQYVQEGGRLYTLTRLDPLWVEAEAYQSELEKIKKGMEVAVKVAGFPKPVKGKVVFVSPEFRAASQIVNVRVEIPNQDNSFIPGMQANVLLPRSEADKVTGTVAVPVNAVIRDEDGAHVWIQTGENTFEPRRVVTLDATAEQVVVTEGLEPEDVIVISGAYLLYSEFVLKKGGHPLAAAHARHAPHAGKLTTAAEAELEEPAVFNSEELAIAFAHYQELKDALLVSEPAAVKEQAKALQLALKAIPEAKEAAEYAQRISGTDVLDEQRGYFFFLNNNFIKLLKGAQLESGQVFVQFCPMANNGQGAYWLSMEEEIRNPYLPENMLGCGEVTDIIK